MTPATPANGYMLTAFLWPGDGRFSLEVIPMVGGRLWHDGSRRLDTMAFATTWLDVAQLLQEVMQAAGAEWPGSPSPFVDGT